MHNCDDANSSSIGVTIINKKIRIEKNGRQNSKMGKTKTK